MKNNFSFNVKRNYKRIFRIQFWYNGLKQHKGFYILPLISIQYSSYDRGLYLGWLNWLLFIGTISKEIE